MISAALFSVLLSAWAATMLQAVDTPCPRKALYRYNARVNAKYLGARWRPFVERRVVRRANPPFWPAEMTLGDKLSRLGLLAPQKLEAIGVLVDRALRDSWPSQQDPLGRGRLCGLITPRKERPDKRQT